jgi:hypothetical protein
VVEHLLEVIGVVDAADPAEVERGGAHASSQRGLASGTSIAAV